MVMVAYIRLERDCTNILYVAVSFMASDSPHATDVYQLCDHICEVCTVECENKTMTIARPLPELVAGALKNDENGSRSAQYGCLIQFNSPKTTNTKIVAIFDELNLCTISPPVLR